MKFGKFHARLAYSGIPKLSFATLLFFVGAFLSFHEKINASASVNSCDSSDRYLSNNVSLIYEQDKILISQPC